MDARTIENIEARFNSAEITKLTTRWKKIVKPGFYRMTGGRWKRYHEPKFLRNERKVIEERLQQLTSNRQPEDLRQIIGPQHRVLSTTNRPLRAMDSGPILGNGSTNPSATTPTGQIWPILRTDPHGRT